jgi:hypothetical protein
MMSHQLNEEACPVADSVLGQLYRCSPHGLAELIETVPTSVRALLAIYCGRRAHLSGIALAIASTCAKEDLIDAGGEFGAALFDQARKAPDASVRRSKISLSQGALMQVIAQDLI